MPQKSIELVVTLTGAPRIEGPVKTIGWGDEGHEMAILGPVANIRVSRDGDSEFSLRILDDGRLILTYYNSGYTNSVPQNLQFIPYRLWTTPVAAVLPPDP